MSVGVPFMSVIEFLLVGGTEIVMSVNCKLVLLVVDAGMILNADVIGIVEVDCNRLLLTYIVGELCAVVVVVPAVAVVIVVVVSVAVIVMVSVVGGK